MSNRIPRINVAISAHGYGHLTQVCAVLQALKATRMVKLRIQCGYPREIVSDRLGFDEFDYDQCQMDVGLVQHDPMQADLQASYRAYADFHSSFQQRVEQQARSLIEWQADLVISDISYLAIAAAKKANVTSIAIASLSWDHIVRAYFDKTDDQVEGWIEEICRSYAVADLALLPEPAMQPCCFTRYQTIPPLLARGRRLTHLRPQLGIEDQDPRPLVFCSLGGISRASMPVEALACDDRFHWIVNVEPQPAPAHVHFYHQDVPWWQPEWSIHDLLASVDAIVSKPGYGMAVEAVAYGLPFVFARRGHFPDEQPIIDWLHQNGRIFELSQDDWFDGHFGDVLTDLMQQSALPVPDCNGAEIAARHMFKIL